VQKRIELKKLIILKKNRRMRMLKEAMKSNPAIVNLIARVAPSLWISDLESIV
jgi:hypothetical protein